MNQIICSSNCNLETTNNNHLIKPRYYHDKKKKFFKTQFILFIIILVFAFIYYLYFNYQLYTSEKLAKNIKSNFEITKIYGNNNEYNIVHLKNENINDTFSIIGIIDIQKLNISYPILSDINKDFLKISPCRFYGPLPNEIR